MKILSFQFKEGGIVFCYEIANKEYYIKLHSLFFASPQQEADYNLQYKVLPLLAIALATEMFDVEYPEKLEFTADFDTSTLELLQNTLKQGLAEFRYKNGIGLTRDIQLIQHKSDYNLSKDIAKPIFTNGYIVANGGGKDGIVALDLLANRLHAENLFSMTLNPNPARDFVQNKFASIETINYRWEIDTKRSQDRVFAGHKPLNFIIAALGIYSAYQKKVQNFVVANEYSANVPTIYIDNYAINHQYTKSIFFEIEFNKIIEQEIGLGLRYLSILRPLYELQIVKLFSQISHDYTGFISCNRAQRQGAWCKRCAKCAFVYLSLRPFIDAQQNLNIFGEELINNEAIQQQILLLTNPDTKPFECIGTTRENLYALKLLLAKVADIIESRDVQMKFQELTANISLEEVDDFIKTAHLQNQDLIPKELRSDLLEEIAKSLNYSLSSFTTPK